MLFSPSISALRPLSLARNNDCIKSGRQKMQRNEHVEASQVFPFIKILKHQLLTYWCLTHECSPACNTKKKKWFFINLWRSTKCQNVLFFLCSIAVFCESRHQKENSMPTRSVGSSYQMLVVHSSLHTAWIIETLHTLSSHIYSRTSAVHTRGCGQQKFGYRCYGAPRLSEVDADEI